MRYIFTLIVLVFVSGYSRAQVEQDTSEIELIFVENANNARFLNQSDTLYRYLNGDVRLVQDSTFMFCDSAILVENQLIAFGNIVIVQNDSINVFADSLVYNGNSKKSKLYNNVILKNGNRELFTDYLEYDLENKIGRYSTGALLKNEKADIKSLVGIYLVNQDLAKFYQKVTITSEDFILRADSLHYNTEKDISYFIGPTIIEQDSSQIYCESGFYDLENELALFEENAQYAQKKKFASAIRIKYDGILKLVSLEGAAEYREEEIFASADTINYFEDTEDTELIGNAFYKDAERSINGIEIFYNASSESFKTVGRSTIQDSTNFLTANVVNFSEEDDFGAAYGDVILQDTSSETSILADTMNYRKSENFYKAFGKKGARPLLISLIDNDSLFIKSDTLLSTSNQDSADILLAFFDVKLYKSDIQAICDSMVYNTSDSVIIMYDNPIIWSDSSQFSADTIIIYLKNNEIDRVDLRNRSFIINTTDSIYFNQIKGKNVEVFFVEGQIDSMTVLGNAESIYFMLDDNNAYIGMNQAVCSKMAFNFEEGELSDIFFDVSVNSTLLPIEKIRGKEQLEGFNWVDKERPQSKLEL